MATNSTFSKKKRNIYIVYSVVGCTSATAESETRDLFSWTDGVIELLLKVMYEYKEVKAVENIDLELNASGP